MFSMLYIAAQLQTFTIDFADGQAESLKAEYLSMKDAFREKAVQCLILARYTTGGPYILETLITVLTGEFVLLKDGATDGWLMISMILHLAMRMGYHRDPDHFPGISPFEGEMRRRIWTTILQLDLVLSLEMGLPRIATDTHIDTKQPVNLRDSDFEEDTTEMPPPRSETEWTPILPLIAKGRLTSALGQICDVNTDINPPSYDEVIKVDALLKDVHNHAIPPVLRWETMPHPITDSPSLVVQRVSVETTYYKSRILLHRRALISYPVRQPQERDRESVQICLDSALKILSFQQMLHEESQPFGRLCQLRWKVTHIFNQDVLLATSVLCLYLQDVDKFELPETAGQTTLSPRAEEIRQRLTISHKIWLQMSTGSAEAGKVAKALSIVLGSTEASAEDGSRRASYDFLTGFDAVPLNDFGATLNNQCEKHTRSLPTATKKETYQISPLASTLLSRFSIMYWKLGGHESMIVLLSIWSLRMTFNKRATIRHAWYKIDEAILQRLMEIMPHCVSAVEAAGGWYTKYQVNCVEKAASNPRTDQARATSRYRTGVKYLLPPTVRSSILAQVRTAHYEPKAE